MTASDTATSGQCERFVSTVDAHWTPIYRLLWALSGDPRECDDLTQETFLRAFRRWETLTPGSSMRGWLLRIATNGFFDERRKTVAMNVAPLDDVFQAQNAPTKVVPPSAENDLVRVAVSELSDLTRLVFHLHVAEGLSLKEISEIADLGEDAARQHIHQGRARLLRRYGDQLRK